MVLNEISMELQFSFPLVFLSFGTKIVVSSGYVLLLFPLTKTVPPPRSPPYISAWFSPHFIRILASLSPW